MHGKCFQYEIVLLGWLSMVYNPTRHIITHFGDGGSDCGITLVTVTNLQLTCPELTHEMASFFCVLKPCLRYLNRISFAYFNVIHVSVKEVKFSNVSTYEYVHRSFCNTVNNPSGRDVNNMLQSKTETKKIYPDWQVEEQDRDIFQHLTSIQYMYFKATMRFTYLFFQQLERKPQRFPALSGIHHLRLKRVLETTLPFLIIKDRYIRDCRLALFGHVRHVQVSK